MPATLRPVSFEPLFEGLLCAGRYRIGEAVGQGAMGQLFRAERLRDGMQVVLKCISGSATASRRQLRSEALALASVSHPNIVALVEYGEASDVSFIAMEALEGEDLGTEMARGRITRATALGYLHELASALDRYALAGIALELLTGERPYPAATIGELLLMLVEQSPRRPSALGLASPELDAVFARAMARDPDRRFDSSAEMIDAIDAALPSALPLSWQSYRARMEPACATVRVRAA